MPIWLTAAFPLTTRNTGNKNISQINAYEKILKSALFRPKNFFIKVISMSWGSPFQPTLHENSSKEFWNIHERIYNFFASAYTVINKFLKSLHPSLHKEKRQKRPTFDHLCMVISKYLCCAKVFLLVGCSGKYLMI